MKLKLRKELSALFIALQCLMLFLLARHRFLQSINENGLKTNFMILASSISDIKADTGEAPRSFSAMEERYPYEELKEPTNAAYEILENCEDGWVLIAKSGKRVLVAKENE